MAKTEALTPQERKRRTKLEQMAGSLAVFRAEKAELIPVKILELKEGSTRVTFKVYVEKDDQKRFKHERSKKERQL